MDAAVIDSIKSSMERAYGKVYAAFVYGSQVCGYATADSDYDVLVILRRYDEGVKYTYVEGDGEIAFLGVSKKVFEEDVKRSAYGGFIADRIINPIHPVRNKTYIGEKEVERKKEIVNWESVKLIFKQEVDTMHTDINILYYPYKKWNQITRIYHPYLYSIENTLRKDLKEKNIRALLPGFQAAIKDLSYLREVYPGWFRIKEKFVKETLSNGLSPKLERMKMVEREIENVVSRYLTHSKAGDSDRDLIVKETISKVKREVRHHLKKRDFAGRLEKPDKFLIRAG